MTENQITASSLFQYSILAMPVAFAGFPLYVLAPDFYTTEYGVSLTTLGVVLLGLRLFDAFQDPLIGTLSDRYRRHITPIIVFSAIILCASIYGLFNQLYLSPLLWFAINIGLAVTAYSILSINLNALGALWTKHSHQQTRIASSREIFGLLGLIIAVSLPGFLATKIPQEDVYRWFTLTLATLMAIALLFFLKWLSKQPKNNHLNKVYFFWSIFKTLSLDSKKLLLVYLISMIASSIPAVLVIFFIRDLIGAEEYLGLFLLLYFLSGVFFMPVWKRMSLTFGKHRSWLFSMILAVVTFIWAFTLKQGDVWQYAVVCITSGMALGGDLVFPPSILADHLHLNQSKNNASTHYALLTLVAKASLALASTTSLPLLESMGFTPKSENSATALMGLNTAYALIPCILKCGSAFLLWRLFIYLKKGENHENNKINNHRWSTHHA